MSKLRDDINKIISEHEKDLRELGDLEIKINNLIYKYKQKYSLAYYECFNRGSVHDVKCAYNDFIKDLEDLMK